MVLTRKLFLFLMLLNTGIGANIANAAENYSSFDLTSAPGGLYELDRTHAYITFTYSHQGYSKPWLRFRDTRATLDLDSSSVADSKLSVVINAASIDSGVDEFDVHLRGKNFFKVDEYPEITFNSTSITIDGDNLVITGDLTIMETTRSVALTGVFNRGGLHFKSKKPMIGISATTELVRSEWGLGYATPFVGDDVSVVIEVEFIRKHPLPPRIK